MKAKNSSMHKVLSIILVGIFFLCLGIGSMEIQAQTICDEYPEQAEMLRLTFGQQCQNPTTVQPDYLPLPIGCPVAFSFPGLGDLAGVITGYKWSLNYPRYEYWILYDMPRLEDGWGGAWAASADVLPLEGASCDVLPG